ncbi:hypothetical protein BDV25DRAFT_145484 [Aspergillus avenaceus]|uniref:NAD(P)-binding protein n=1 Tax=Aspergillus avenaceus TaxID=36643 RepID=A0A5N6TDW8_ASPAV|nr:hypothetical protein BDV25DRAFT_145484 [Aspergillus avenaceus]
MLSWSNPDGCIVNIVSLAGKAGWTAGAAYTASKHGLVGLTKNTASFYGNKGIRCNALMIGGMDTNITDAFTSNINQEGMQRTTGLLRATQTPLCDVDSVAELCLSLTCGKGARLINGAYGLSAVLPKYELAYSGQTDILRRRLDSWNSTKSATLALYRWNLSLRVQPLHTLSGTSTDTGTPAAENKKENSELSAGAKAGIGVGITVVVLICAGSAFLYVRHRKSDNPDEPANKAMEQSGSADIVAELTAQLVFEADSGAAKSLPAELETPPVELPGDDLPTNQVSDAAEEMNSGGLKED